jgi:hypothetical protein
MTLDSRHRRTRALAHSFHVLRPSVGAAIALLLFFPGCSSSSSGHGSEADAGTSEAQSDPPETGTPEAAGKSDGPDIGSCAGLCADGATTTFVCTSNSGDFTMTSGSSTSTCSNYGPVGSPMCSPAQTTLNAAVNLNYLELDCDGVVRSAQDFPCTDQGTWTLQGSTLTLDLTQKGLTATCTKQ